MKHLLVAFCFTYLCILLNAQLPSVVAGRIERIDSFPSKFISARNVDVWLPEDYTPDKKYAVLYMHDGQMLYDTAAGWNKQSWDVDDVITKLLNEHAIRDVIVVGVWNGGKTRHPDYFPQKPYEALSQVEQDTITAQLQRAGRTKDVFKPESDNYLKFLVKELKPFVDRKYSTFTNRSNTFIAGSSMGGLISMYAICEYPKIFGGAACLSTHWPGIFAMDNNPIPQAFLNYMSKNLPNSKKHKIYFDYGDQTLDAMYPPLHPAVDSVMKLKGFAVENWVTKFFPGENHSEKAWNKRLDIPMLFLLKN